MLEEKVLNKNLNVIVNMKSYGENGFIQSLADCFFNAGKEDFKKLREAFPEYWEKYENFKP